VRLTNRDAAKSDDLVRKGTKVVFRKQAWRIGKILPVLLQG